MGSRVSTPDTLQGHSKNKIDICAKTYILIITIYGWPGRALKGKTVQLRRGPAAVTGYERRSMSLSKRTGRRGQ